VDQLSLWQFKRWSQRIEIHRFHQRPPFRHERHEGFGARAWKGFDWDTMNRLHEKGYISNPIGKTKSVGMTEEGFLKAKELFERHFRKK